MKINSINNANFKGLWFREDVATRTQPHGNIEQTIEFYTYRPFCDEKPKEINNEIQKYDNKQVKDYYLFGPEINSLVRIKARLGATLNISSDEYAKMRNPLDVKYPGEEKRAIID